MFFFCFSRPQTIFGSKHFDLLEEFVTAFSVMTYDYSNFMRTPGQSSKKITVIKPTKLPSMFV